MNEEMKFAYTPIKPVASYSPWLVDDDFVRLYEIVKDYTLVDIYRLYELFSLTRQLIKLPEGDILEVGVWRGGSGALLAQTAELCNFKGRVFLADTFQGVVKAGDMDSKYKGGEHADTSRDTVEYLLSNILDLKNFEILEGVFPDQTGAPLEDRKFRLCHIDVDVYDSAKDVNEWVWERLVPGGMVIYDDYGFETCVGVTRYVNEQKGINDRIVMHNLNGHAIVYKLY